MKLNGVTSCCHTGSSLVRYLTLVPRWPAAHTPRVVSLCMVRNARNSAFPLLETLWMDQTIRVDARFSRACGSEAKGMRALSFIKNSDRWLVLAYRPRCDPRCSTLTFYDHATDGDVKKKLQTCSGSPACFDVDSGTWFGKFFSLPHPFLV